MGRSEEQGIQVMCVDLYKSGNGYKKKGTCQNLSICPKHFADDLVAPPPSVRLRAGPSGLSLQVTLQHCEGSTCFLGKGAAAKSRCRGPPQGQHPEKTGGSAVWEQARPAQPQDEGLNHSAPSLSSLSHMWYSFKRSLGRIKMGKGGGGGARARKTALWHIRIKG